MTGLAHDEGHIAYGPELLSLWRGAMRLAHGRDPGTQFQTVWLTV